MSETEFALDVDVTAVTASDGTSDRRRPPVGDYQVEVVDVIQTPNKKGNHVMLVPTLKIVAARDPKNKEGVGMQIGGEGANGYYLAGSAASPTFLQARLANFLDATGLPRKGQITKKQLIGRKFDVTILWQLSDPQTNAETGATIRYINVKIVGERKSGVARAKNIDPDRDSKEAIAYSNRDSEAEPAAEAGAHPWAKTTEEPTVAAASKGYLSEDQVPDEHHTYRAYKALGESVEQVTEAMIEAGVDPDGPVDVAKLTDEGGVKEAYLAKFPPKAKGFGGGLPPINSKPKTGTRTAATK